MPIQKCSANGTSGFKWGNAGKCYTGKDAKQKAIRQGLAENGGKFTEGMSYEDYIECKEALLDILGDIQSTNVEVNAVRNVIFANEGRGPECIDVDIEYAKQLARKSINDLPDSDFAYIEPGGKKDSSGKTEPRSLRHLPIADAAHVRNALARLPQTDIPEAAKKEALAKIESRAKKFGIKVTGS